MKHKCPVCLETVEFIKLPDQFSLFCEECSSYINSYDFTGDHQDLLNELENYLLETLGDDVGVFIARELADFPKRVIGGDCDPDEFAIHILYDYGFYFEDDYLEVREYIEEKFGDRIVDGSGEGFYVIKES